MFCLALGYYDDDERGPPLSHSELNGSELRFITIQSHNPRLDDGHGLRLTYYLCRSVSQLIADKAAPSTHSWTD